MIPAAAAPSVNALRRGPATQVGLLRSARRLGDLDLLALAEGFVEELAFERGEPHGGRGPPLLEDVEPTAGE